ncbi:MAG: signal transduction histidine kinase [Flavobacteriales bacterium]|jgi:signal transduction histidine kinase
MKGLFLLVFLFITHLIYAQTGNVYHEVFSKKDGLVIDVPSSIVFDDDGFLWIGGTSLDTRAIIYASEPLVIQRFNGNVFHNILLPIEEKEIRGVAQIYKRSDGQFYIICEGLNETVKLYLFNPRSTEFIEVPIDWSQAIARNVSNIYFYKGEEYLLIQRDRTISVNKLKPTLGIEELFTFTSNENKFKVDNKSVLMLYEDFLIISDDNFPITFLDWQGTILHRYASDTFLRTRDIMTKKFWIENSFSHDDKQYLFIDDKPQLYEIDTENYRVIPSKIPNTSFEASSSKGINDAQGNHRVIKAQDDALLFYELSENGFKKTFEASVFKGAPTFYGLSKDLTKDLWLITNQSELHYFKFPSDKVTHYLSDYGMRVVKDWDEDHYLAASDAHGWFKIHKQTQQVSKLIFEENGALYSPKYTVNAFVEGDIVWSNSLGNVLKINKKSMTSEAFRHYPVSSMIRPDDSTIFYGTHRYNLMSFNTRTKEHKALLKTASLDIDGMDISMDKRTIVCATDKGILTYDRTDKTHQLLGKEVLDDPFLLMMTKHPKGGYLFGSRKGNIYSYTLGGVPKKVYSDEQEAGIGTVLFDDNGSWWIYTFNGLVVFNPVDNSTRRFSVKDGLSHNEGNRHSAFKTEEGMFFGSLKGLNFFNPSDLIQAQRNDRLELLRVRQFDTKINAFKESLDRSAFAKAKKIILPAENRTLELDFNLTRADVTREETYRYRLNEGEWVDLKSTTNIRFPNLESGTYNLEIGALDFSGRPIGDLLVIQVIVRNFFYKTGWFYLLLSPLCIVLLGWMLYQLKLRSDMQVAFAQNLMQSQEEERTRIAKELHDSVGQQLTLIKRKAQRSQQDEIAQLTNRTLEEVRSISRGLYPALLKQLGLTGSIEQLFLEIDEQTDLFVSVDVVDVDVYFNAQESLNLYRFIQENVTNVIKHAQATTLAVLIEKRAHYIGVEIKDNGRGFNSAERLRQNSLGLKTMQERIKMLKGIFTLESGINTGTLVSAEIPIKR